MSVSSMCDAGHHVIFTSEGGWIYNLLDGSYTRFERQDDVYMLGLWISSKDATGKSPETSGNIDEYEQAAYQAWKNTMKQAGVIRPGA